MFESEESDYIPPPRKENPHIPGIEYNKWGMPMLGKKDLSHYYREPPAGDILLSGRGVFVEKGHSQFEKNVTNEQVKQIQNGLKEAGINPDNYPRVADLGAGSSPFFRLVLEPIGWKADELTSFDLKIPEKNPIPGSKWSAVNLHALEHALYGGWEIPRKLLDLKGEFDFATMTYGLDWGPISSLESVGTFLLRKKGVVFENFGQAGQLLGNSGRWEVINTKVLPFHFWKRK